MEFYTKVVGVTFDNRQRHIRRTSEGERVTLEREPGNLYDSNAIKVMNEAGNQIGHISKDLASSMAPRMDAGVVYHAKVTAITGTNPGENLGVNLLIECE